jgi:hypothetical protein
LENFRIGFAQAINSKSSITNETYNVPTTTTEETITSTATTTKPGNIIDIELIKKNLFTFLYLLFKKLLLNFLF